MNDSLKYYRDLKNSLDTAKEEGFMEGKLEGILEGKLEGKLEEKLEIARNALKMGFSLEQVQLLTNLSIEQLKQL